MSARQPPPARRNRWRESALELPSTWTPHRSVSVVIPAYNAGATLDLTLASLAEQDYPATLLDVVVVDDGSDERYQSPAIAPENLRVIRPENGWGRANACHTGAIASDGEIIMWLDADMILEREHVRRQVEWYDRLSDVVTKGEIIFVEKPAYTAAQVRDAVQNGTVGELIGAAEGSPQWVDAVYRRTDDLNDAGPTVFTIYTGASASVSRELYDEVGGMDCDLRLGEDTELAYRLAQAGAVFVPARDALSYHLDKSTDDVRGAQAHRYNNPFYAQRAPLVAKRRTSTGRQWSVPKVRAVVEIDQHSARYARSVVDRLLSGTEEDLHVDLVGPWETLHQDRRPVLDDPATELYLVAEWYRSEGRVSLVSEVPSDVFPSPYRLDLPATAGVGATTVAELLSLAEKTRAGLVRVPLSGRILSGTIDLWRTAAVSRARRDAASPDELTALVDKVWGTTIDREPARSIVDLRTVEDLPEHIQWRRGAKIS